MPFPILMEHFGCNSIEETKLALMGECWGYQRDKITGRELPIKPNTSDMSVDEGVQFTDWMIRWAMVNHGVDIPPPEKVSDDT